MGARLGRSGGQGARVSVLLGYEALIASILVALVWTVLFAKSWRGLSRTPRILPLAGRGQCANVVAFMPARNEAEVIEASVRALLGQVDRLVVIDDGSTDGTSAILSRFSEPGLAVRMGDGPKAGECGKPAALAGAVEAEAPASEWLLFVDADVVLEAGAVAALLGLAEEAKADLVSIVPKVEMRTAIEHLVMPAVGALVLAQYPPDDVRDPKRKVAFANGQLILVRRRIYEAAGGHRAVIDRILEDVELAKRVKGAGGRLVLADGGAVARTRMYAGWSEIVEGWSKNLYLLFGSRAGVALGWASLTIALSWWPPMLAVAAFPVGLSAYLLVLAYQMILRKKGGGPALLAVFAPISSLLAAVILIRSTMLHVGRRAIAWKGREYRP